MPNLRLSVFSNCMGIVLRQQRDLLQPRCLRQAEHDVHVLHCLPGRAFTSFDADGHDVSRTAGAQRYGSDWRLWQVSGCAGGHDIDKSLAGVALFIK